jgi:DNA-binding transcriptional regulator LsrR (DeoR family)
VGKSGYLFGIYSDGTRNYLHRSPTVQEGVSDLCAADLVRQGIGEVAKVASYVNAYQVLFQL